MRSKGIKIGGLFRALIGLVFLFSGLLKLMDPVGTMLIVTEYAKFFGTPFIIPAAKALGIGLGLVESLTGTALLSGVLRRLSYAITWALLGVFTVITLILWIKNPQMDCGCFGEAIHLTHLQSLLKNILLLVFAGIGLTPLSAGAKPAGVKKWVRAGVLTLSVVFVTVYSCLHIPALDFTAFAPGEVILASFDGRASTQSHPVLSIRDAEGEYQDSMAAEGKVVVLSVYDPASVKWNDLRLRYAEILDAGASPILLIAGGPEDAASVPPEMDAYFSDYKTLITLNRSNGGGSYLWDGEIITKWALRDAPSGEKLSEWLREDPIDLCTSFIQKRRVAAQGFTLGLIALLIFV